MIASSRERRRSACPLSRRSLGRVVVSSDALRNHRITNQICKESPSQPRFPANSNGRSLLFPIPNQDVGGSSRKTTLSTPRRRVRPARVPERALGPESSAQAARRQAGAVGQEPEGGARGWRVAQQRITVDIMVQPRAISFPTDAELLHTAIKGLNRLATRYGIRLRQAYSRVAKAAAMMGGRYANSSSGISGSCASCAADWAGSSASKVIGVSMPKFFRSGRPKYGLRALNLSLAILVSRDGAICHRHPVVRSCDNCSVMGNTGSAYGNARTVTWQL